MLSHKYVYVHGSSNTAFIFLSTKPVMWSMWSGACFVLPVCKGVIASVPTTEITRFYKCTYTIQLFALFMWGRKNILSTPNNSQNPKLRKPFQF